MTGLKLEYDHKQKSLKVELTIVGLIAVVLTTPIAIHTFWLFG